MFFIPAIIVVLGLVIYWCKLTRDSGLFAKDVPGPKSYPIVGSTHLFMGSDEQTFTVINDLFRKYSWMFKLSLGPKTVLCLSHPDLIQQVLTSRACQDKAFFYRFFEIDYGLISSCYADWKLYRKMLNPAFNQRILISFISIFTRCSEDMVSRMAKEVDSPKPFDMLHYTTQCTLEMVCASSLKSDITDNPLAKDICGGIERICAIMCSRVYNVLLYSDLLFNMTPRYREMDGLRNKLKEMLDPIVSERREEMAKERLENPNLDEEENYRKPMVFLDQLLNMKRGDEDLTTKEIENHLHTIIAAGSETSANQVAYILLQLAMHPDVQDRVYEEIRSIYGDSSLNITYETISAQTYLEQVIKETLRLFPVAPFIGRKTIETVKLGDVVVPPGVTLIMNIMNVHRSKELWGERADVFDPDRFDPTTYDARDHHPFSYIPFGGGPRNYVPGPKSYPIIGCTHLFVGSDEQTFGVINELFRKYNWMFKLSLGPKPTLCLSHPDLIQQALTSKSCQDKAFFYRFIEMDYGLISSRYADWKLYRKLLNPAFNQRILISFISIFTRCSEDMVSRMAKEEDSPKPFDMLHYTTQCTLEMVCASSLKSDLTEPQAKTICGDLERICVIMSSRLFNVLLYSDLLFTFTQRYKELQELRIKLKQVVDPILFGRREEIQKERLDKPHLDEEEQYRKPMVFLDQLLNMKRGEEDLAMEEIENHLYTIIGA
uniref:Cytochrome P450 n=1 Tax=Anopheles culicifacies TaxID=139723 RepID=A0A182MTH7_9DIPT